MSKSFHHAVIVACHAGFKKDVTGVPDAPEEDQHWVLEPFQKKEPPFYIAHIRHGVSLVNSIPGSLLLFSGGITHKDMGEWTEADSYYAVAEYYKWWLEDHDILESKDSVRNRSSVEQYARDSFENLVFSICRFQEITSRYPDEVTVVSWAFKENRFELHREALRFPVRGFHYEGINDPVDLQAAFKGEAETVQLFKRYPYGTGGELLKKRNKRDPSKRDHPYRRCEKMESFFRFIDDSNNSSREYDGGFPWE